MSKSITKSITVITDCHVYDEYAEGPSFVAFTIDADFIKEVKAYREAMETMKANGLDPFKVSTFSSPARFLDPIEADPLNEEEAKSLRFFSESTKAEWEYRFEPLIDDDDDTSYLDDLEGDNYIETDMMNITDMGVSVSGYIKHCDVRVESNVLYEADFEQIEKWLEELNV
jgi:hypothetical protein